MKFESALSGKFLGGMNCFVWVAASKGLEEWWVGRGGVLD